MHSLTKRHLINGFDVTLRPLRPEDEALERDFIERLSPESRYLRLFTPMPRLPPELLDYFVHVDYERSMALLATVIESEGEREIGVARYYVLSGTRSADFAIVVADDWRGTGLARALMNALIEAAREVHHLETLQGITLAENQRMLGLGHSLGFESRPDPDDPEVVRLRLTL
jgi:acetyltransferase